MSSDPMSSVAGTPASPSATPALEEEPRTLGTSGRTWHDPFAFFDPDGCCWRTSQGTFLWGSETSSVTWPTAGTTVNGTAYQRQPLVPRTSATASSSWPTPTVGDSKNTANRTADRSSPDHHHDGVTLVDAVRLWPTPQHRDGQGRSTPNQPVAMARYQAGRRCLEDVVSLNGDPGGMLNPTWVEWLMGFPEGWTDLDVSETP